MMDRALAMDGTVSGEHAIGIGKKVRDEDPLDIEMADDEPGMPCG